MSGILSLTSTEEPYRLDRGVPWRPETQPDKNLPGVLFTMRYPDDTGFVWNTIALGRDRTAFHLKGHGKCFIGYPRLTGTPSYQHEAVWPVELDGYDMSPTGKNRLELFIRNNRIKVIVFMSALPSTVDLRFLRNLGVRTINTENDSFDHRIRDSLPKKTAKFFFRRILKYKLHDLHLANAKSQYSFLLSHAQIPTSRLALLTNGVDCDRFVPAAKQQIRCRLHLDKDAFWVIFVAQARPEKRLDWIVRAASKVIAARTEHRIKFLYVGDGPLFENLRALVEGLGLNEHFCFVGRQNDMTQFYQAADLMVHASERESFGLAIVEAMACGIPVVACAAAGPSETVIHGKTGRLVPLDEFDGFVEEIINYIDHPETIRQHGMNARKHASSQYSINEYGKTLAYHIQKYLPNCDAIS